MSRLREELGRLVRDDDSGQGMVEFVLVFPMQLLLTLAIIQFAFLVHAHLVVAQGAFLGARAAAVSDMIEGVSTQEAARRVVARQLGVLTSGGHELGAGDSHRLDWGASGGRVGYPEHRQREVFALLHKCDASPNDVANNPDGFVSCDVEFDYILNVPVANTFFAQFSAAPGAHGYKTFRVRRVGFVATPWSVPPK